MSRLAAVLAVVLLAGGAVDGQLGGRRLASGGSDGTVRPWERATGAGQATVTGHHGWVTAVAFSPDGQRLASASWDGTVRLWDRTPPPAPGRPL